MTHLARALQPTSAGLLSEAVHRNRAFSPSGLLERTFTFAFRAMVYPQIWEDPRADMEALELNATSRLITIASGGCNALSYLSANPARIYAVDLNETHIALVRLKLAALAHLPNHATFRHFFGGASDRSNAELYDDLVAPHLDPQSRSYWEGRDLTGRRRISRFGRNFFRFGLLGRFIGASHAIAKLLGGNPAKIATAQSLDEQRRIFDAELAPLFGKPLLRWLTSNRASLFGLGIPPAQYDALCDHGARHMADVLHERVRKLATGFDLKDNYFAWQAFARRYQPSASASLPPYLQKENFADLKRNAGRLTVLHANMIHVLRDQPADSLDRYVLLDAQDWMDDATLNTLWLEITRTARPGARLIFRTAGRDTILPGRVADALLTQWHYDAERSAEIFANDRSAIYGGFHLYIKAE